MEDKEIIIDQVLESPADEEIEVSIIGGDADVPEDYDGIAVIDIIDMDEPDMSDSYIDDTVDIDNF